MTLRLRQYQQINWFNWHYTFHSQIYFCAPFMMQLMVCRSFEIKGNTFHPPLAQFANFYSIRAIYTQYSLLMLMKNCTLFILNVVANSNVLLAEK